MLGTIVALPFKLVWFAVRLAFKIVLMPIKAIVAGLMLQLALFLAFIAVIAVVAYFVYQWIV
jgi:hypothetical protein